MDTPEASPASIQTEELGEDLFLSVVLPILILIVVLIVASAARQRVGEALVHLDRRRSTTITGDRRWRRSVALMLLPGVRGGGVASAAERGEGRYRLAFHGSRSKNPR